MGREYIGSHLFAGIVEPWISPARRCTKQRSYSQLNHTLAHPVAQILLEVSGTNKGKKCGC